MTLPEFFDQLEEGEEYLTLLCAKDVYAQIPTELMNQMVISSVRPKNESFKSDPVHKEHVKKLRKAKKELSDYEYSKNNL